jgi:Tol biopolymer transport system component
MSPEQAEGKPIDRRSDIFSFGVILYEMVTGHRPFSGDTRLALLSAIVHSEPKTITSTPPAELDRLIRRCLRKDPAQRFQHMDDLKISLSDLKEESASGALSSAQTAPSVSSNRSSRWLALSAVAVFLAAIATVWVLSRSKAVAPGQLTSVRQFTFDSGLTTEPTWWPAGNMVAYASDRATGANLDIWVQQIGGTSRQLTSNPADDHEPDFSPDGTKVAFRSERDGGGIFVVSTLGDSERRLTSTGYSPRFSPDGHWLAYWVGDVSRQYGLGKTFIIPASGGEPQDLAPKLRGAMLAAWSSDSKHLLFLSYEKGKPEFYVQSLDGGDPNPTGLADIAQSPILGNYPTAWIGNQFVFSAPSGDAINLFSIEIDPVTFHARGPRQRLTAGTGIDSRPLLFGNRLIYSSVVQNDDVWSVPIDSSTSKSLGQAVRLTQDLGSDIGCSVSEDGTRMAWYSVRSEEAHLMARDLTTGREIDLITVRRARPMAADISADGQRIAYTSRTSTAAEGAGFLIPFGGGTPEKVCDPCTVRDWAGANALLVSNANAMYVTDVTSHKQRQIASAVAPARGFPDGRWWAGYMPQGALPASMRAPSIYVTPILPDRPAAIGDMIPITPGAAGDYLVDVAPDGATLFFLSPRDGFHCIWAQKLAPATHRAAGDPFAVYHAHSARHSTIYVSGGMRRLTASRNRIVFTMAERTGNIWIADLPGAKR